MDIYELNRPLFDLPSNHPARRFLEAFILCRDECVGQEIALPGGIPIDQTWMSTTDSTEWRFSSFAYRFLSFDVELDGWLTNPPQPTESEVQMLNGIPLMQTLLRECKTAATREHNAAIMPLIAQVEELLNLWEDCIRSRSSETAKP